MPRGRRTFGPAVGRFKQAVGASPPRHRDTHPDLDALSGVVYRQLVADAATTDTATKDTERAAREGSGVSLAGLVGRPASRR
jgi:hypothetical protein